MAVNKYLRGASTDRFAPYLGGGVLIDDEGEARTIGWGAQGYFGVEGFVIDAAVARHATGKPVVERNVQYLRESFFRGETWLDRDHVQREAIRWCVEVAGQRLWLGRAVDAADDPGGLPG